MSWKRVIKKHLRIIKIAILSPQRDEGSFNAGVEYISNDVADVMGVSFERSFGLMASG
jgi:hypothetical protein